MMDSSLVMPLTQKKSVGSLSNWFISRKLFPNSLSRHFCGYKARHFTILQAPDRDPALTTGIPTSFLKYLTENISLLLVRSLVKSSLKDRFTGTRKISIYE